MDQNLEALPGADPDGRRGADVISPDALSDEAARMTAKLNVTAGENPAATADRDRPAEGIASLGALRLARGVCRALSQLGSSVLSELRLPNGRRADIVGLDRKGGLTIVEIKSSVEDFRSDEKWPEYLDCCDSFYFAVASSFPRTLIPESCGLMVADGYGAAIVRPAGVRRLDPSRRRAVTLAFALSAAQRLHRLADPLVTDGIAQHEGIWR